MSNSSPLDSSTIIINRTNSRINISFDTPEECILFLSETFDSHWRAELDGERIRVIKTNGAFCAFAVPQGSHRIKMLFSGDDVIQGGIVSLAALIAIIILQCKIRFVVPLINHPKNACTTSPDGLD